jgi:hypothetical protein
MYVRLAGFSIEHKHLCTKYKYSFKPPLWRSAKSLMSEWPELVKEFPRFTLFTRLRIVFILSQINPIHALQSRLFQTNFNNILPLKPKSF